MMGRPLGDISAAVLARLAQDGPMTMRDLAVVEQVHTRTLWWTMERLVASGRVTVIESTSVAWARRPVARYALPTRPASRSSLSQLWGSA